MIIQDYLQYFEVESLNNDAPVHINLPTELLDCGVHIKEKQCFLYNTKGNNDRIFNILGIDNKYSFVKKIVGYDVCGGFPEVESKEDLLKVIIALDKECIKKFGDKHVASESKSKPTSESNLFSKEKRKRRYQLDFNIH